jgi:hypothetical protein
MSSIKRRILRNVYPGYTRQRLKIVYIRSGKQQNARLNVAGNLFHY